ncbi:hypothetical protein [Methylosinus sp. PW1]|uniref:hypothetical protein n=1 Tax=Methylosinus sp. PW1 TaxID=107636 RepID=UPI00056D1EFC|nr:hypothetical protein [Methylosinus sp. PW1]
MQRIFGNSIDNVARSWRAGAITSDAAMERVYRLLPLGDREEYLYSLAGTDRAAQAVAERRILARQALEIVEGKCL